MIFSQDGEVVIKIILQPIQVTGKNGNSNFFSYKIFLCFPFFHVLCLIKGKLILIFWEEDWQVVVLILSFWETRKFVSNRSFLIFFEGLHAKHPLRFWLGLPSGSPQALRL